MGSVPVEDPQKTQMFIRRLVLYIMLVVADFVIGEKPD
jgi:hypothetical protein